jgi:hypothetical protein
VEEIIDDCSNSNKKKETIMNKLLCLIVFLIYFSPAPLFAREILGSQESEVTQWATEHGYKVEGTKQENSGCLERKKYLLLSSEEMKVYTVFYHPDYKEISKVVTLVEFEPTSPISKEKANKLVTQAAPIAGTRPPTQQQKISPDSANLCGPKNGGFEGRYTNDYIAEYYYAPGGSLIERVRVYNENVR